MQGVAQWVFSVGVSFLALTIVAICVSAAESKVAHAAFDETRNVTVGGQFSVSLPIYLGSGFTWVTNGPAEVVVLSSTREISSREPGSGAKQLIRLVARRRGDFIVTWQLSRPRSSPIRVYRVLIHAQ